jgi:hypothetical protein
MKKFSLLIVCLCAGLAFVSQAQDTERVAPASGDAPSLNGARPGPWVKPIGPRPVEYANGGSCSGDVTDDDGSGGSPLDDLEKGRVRPGGEANVAPAGGEAPSLNGGLPSPWERPIGPGPRPIWYANGGSGSGDVTDDDCSGGSPLDGLEKGTVRPGTVLPNIKPGGDQTNGGLRPGVDHGPIVWAPSHESGGSPMVADMVDHLLGGFKDVPDVNGDDKFDVSDVATVIDLLLMTQ